jgi:hypothetical protein
MIECKVAPEGRVDDLETIARTLEASGTYRVLRRLAPHIAVKPPPGVVTRQGLVVDVETTGLAAARQEIIELAMVPFTYGLDGRIYAVGEPFHGLRQPSEPISAEITLFMASILLTAKWVSARINVPKEYLSRRKWREAVQAPQPKVGAEA